MVSEYEQVLSGWRPENFQFFLLLVSGSVWQFLSVSPGLAGLRSSNTEDGNGCHGGHRGADALGLGMVVEVWIQ